MAKRFTDSEKWEDSWFLELSNEYKLAWIYLLDKCDHAGFYKVNIRMMNFCLNSTFTEKSILDILIGRIQVLSTEKWFIPKFINFQYGDLDDSSRFHKSILKTLKNEGVLTEYRQGMDTPQDKDKVLDKDKDKNNINNETDISDHDKAKSGWWESFWFLYPRKVGMSNAMHEFAGQIRTDKDFSDLMIALKNYINSDEVKANKKMNCDRWLADWRGWLEMSKKPKSELDKYEVKK
jgi:hypothetical protein